MSSTKRTNSEVIKYENDTLINEPLSYNNLKSSLKDTAHLYKLPFFT